MNNHGFVLSEAAQYAFKCQDVYPDILSFAAAIPDNLKPIFLIPVRMEAIVASTSEIAVRIAEGAMDGSTPEGDLFSYQTFLYNDIEPTVPSSEPGSIFDIPDADSKTHHQEYNWDQNIQVPTDTSYMSDVDITQYQSYPYRTEEKPVRKSSVNEPPVLIYRLAYKSKYLETKTPEKIKKNAKSCKVSLVSYIEGVRTFIFSVDCGNGSKTVRAALSDLDHVALSCDCKFWRFNGPEFNAKNNRFLLGNPTGTALVPNVRDPKKKYWLCKHTYAVVTRLDQFMKEILSENWEMLDDEDILEVIDNEWDRMTEVAETPLDDFEKPEVDIDWEQAEEEQEEPVQLTQQDIQYVEEPEEEPEEEQEEPIQLTQQDIQYIQDQGKDLKKKSPPPLPKR